MQPRQPLLPKYDVTRYDDLVSSVEETLARLDAELTTMREGLHGINFALSIAGGVPDGEPFADLVDDLERIAQATLVLKSRLSRSQALLIETMREGGKLAGTLHRSV